MTRGAWALWMAPGCCRVGVVSGPGLVPSPYLREPCGGSSCCSLAHTPKTALLEVPLPTGPLEPLVTTPASAAHSPGCGVSLLPVSLPLVRPPQAALLCLMPVVPGNDLCLRPGVGSSLLALCCSACFRERRPLLLCPTGKQETRDKSGNTVPGGPTAKPTVATA